MGPDHQENPGEAGRIGDYRDYRLSRIKRSKILTKEEVMQEVENSNVEIVEDKFAGLGPNRELMDEAVDDYMKDELKGVYRNNRSLSVELFRDGVLVRDSLTKMPISFDEARNVFNNVPLYNETQSSFQSDPVPITEGQYENGQRFFSGGGLPQGVIVTEVDAEPRGQFNLFTRKEDAPKWLSLL